MDGSPFALEREDGGHARSSEPAGKTVPIFGGAWPIVVRVLLCPSGPEEPTHTRESKPSKDLGVARLLQPGLGTQVVIADSVSSQVLG